MHSVAAANKYGVVVYECADAHDAALTRRADNCGPNDPPLARPH